MRLVAALDPGGAALRTGAAVLLCVLLWGALAWRRTRQRAVQLGDRFAAASVTASGARATFVVFTSPTCAPCKQALDVVTAVSQRHGGAIGIAALDAASEEALTYGVRSVPTVLLVERSGGVLRTWCDVPSRADVSTAIEEILEAPAATR